MEIRHLRYFVAMAEAGSLMKASERLHVAQPALSVHLSNIEVELGVQLVSRSNRGVELTEDGKLLYDRAVVLLRYHEEAVRALKQRKNVPSGSVSLGILSTCSDLFAADLYRSVRAELPNVNLYVAETSSAVLYEWLHARRIDFAIVFNLPDNIGLDVSPLFMEDFYLASKPEPGGVSDEINFDDIFNYPLVGPCRSTTWRKILDDMAEKRGKMLDMPLESESMQMLKTIARSGQAHAILPRSCLNDEIERGELWARRIVNPAMRGVLSLASLSSMEPTLAHHAVREIVVQIARDISDRWRVSQSPTAGSVTPLIRAVPSLVLPVHRRSANSK